jgi:hypothetical protein
MSMTFEQLKTLLEQFGALEVGKGATKAAIEAAERALGIAIRGDYRRFVEEYGWGGVGCMELYGLGDDVPRHLNLVDITTSERTEMSPRLRTELLPIMNDGGGNLYCLDTRTEGPEVVFWDHEDTPNQDPSVEASDFSEWLASKLTEMQ